MDVIYPVMALIVVLVVVLLLLFLSVRVVGPDERLVVFRLGRSHAGLVREPGVRLLIPIVDRPVRVDMREQRATLPGLAAVTADDVPVTVEASIAWRVVDPLQSVVNVAYLPGALKGVAATTVRAVVGDVVAPDVPFRLGEMSELFLATLEEVAARWGAVVSEARIDGVKRLPAAP